MQGLVLGITQDFGFSTNFDFCNIICVSTWFCCGKRKGRQHDEDFLADVFLTATSLFKHCIIIDILDRR